MTRLEDSWEKNDEKALMVQKQMSQEQPYKTEKINAMNRCAGI